MLVQLFHAQCLSNENTGEKMNSVSLRTKLGFLWPLVESHFIPTPLVYIWEATYRCNMRCWFCKKWRLDPGYHTNELETEDALNLLRQSVNLGARLFYVTGGEPLLRQDIDLILSHAKQLGMVTMLGTNGYFLENSIGRIGGKVDYLRVSIDSLKHHDEIRGVSLALSKTVAGIRCAKETGMRVVINAVISSQNIEEMEDLVKLAEGLKCEITLSPVMHDAVSNDREPFRSQIIPLYKRYAAYVRSLKRKHTCLVNTDTYLDLVEQGGIGYTSFLCRAANITLSVSPQGEVYFPCNYFPAKKIPVMKAARLRRIWFSDTAKKIRKEMKGYASCVSCTNRCYLLPSLLFSIRGLINIIKNPIERRRIL